MVGSIQHLLDRVRPPRVQITYDVEIGSAIVMKELPFVMGIIADLSGMPATPLPRVKDRKFIEIDRDNFNEVMESLRPRLALQVANKLTNDKNPIKVELFFHSIEDFSPLNVVKQIPALAKIYDSRSKLKDLLAKLDGNDELNELLQLIIIDAQQREGLKTELGIKDTGTPPPSTPGAPETPPTPTTPTQPPSS